MAKLNAEQRVHAIKRYLYGNNPIEKIARIGISTSILSGWIRLYESHRHETFLKSYTKNGSTYLSNPSKTAQGDSSVEALEARIR